MSENSDRSWKAYRLDISLQTELYTFIKENIIQFVDQNNLRFWITNYYTPGRDPNPHSQFRVYVNQEQQTEVETYLDELVGFQKILRRGNADLWDPKHDAKSRIKGTRKKIEEGKEVIPKEYLDAVNPDEERIEELAALFSVMGECTKTFYKVLPRKPIDPYVISLALHILFNSLTYGFGQEKQIRTFPPI